MVDALAGAVGGDGDHIQVVDGLEFRGLGGGGAGHAGQLLVHPEVVLDGDGGQGLGFPLDLHVLLGLQGLVETLGEAAPRLGTPGELVHNDHLVVLDHILDILLEEAVGPEELGDVVEHLRLLVVFHLDGLASLHLLLGGEGGIGIQVAEDGGEIGDDEGLGIGGHELAAPLFREFGFPALFVHGEEELLLHFLEEAPVHIGVPFGIHPLQTLADGGILHEAPEELVLGHADLDLGQEVVGLVLLLGGGIGLVQQALGLLEQSGHQLILESIEGLHLGFHHVVHVGGDLGGAGDDQGGTGLVDEDGVDLIHDGVEVVPLDQLLPGVCHAHVPEVVEAEFGVGSVGDVAGVLFPAHLGGLVVLDAAHGEAQPPVEVSHPLGVPSGQIVVDGDQLDIASGEGIEIEGHGGHQGLSLAGGHFGDLGLVEDDAAHDLDIEGNHVPLQAVARDFHEVLFLLLGLLETAAGVLHHGEGLAEDVVGGLAVLEAVLELLGLGLELLVGEGTVLLRLLVHLVHQGPEFADHPFIAAAEEFFDNPVEKHLGAWGRKGGGRRRRREAVSRGGETIWSRGAPGACPGRRRGTPQG